VLLKLSQSGSGAPPGRVAVKPRAVPSASVKLPSSRRKLNSWPLTATRSGIGMASTGGLFAGRMVRMKSSDADAVPSEAVTLMSSGAGMIEGGVTEKRGMAGSKVIQSGSGAPSPSVAA